jgi:hypothetical protein
MGMKLLSHLMKLLYLMTLTSQQFYLCGTIFYVHDTLMKHALRLALCKTLGDGLFLDFTFCFGNLQTTTNTNSIMQNPWRCSKGFA